MPAQAIPSSSFNRETGNLQAFHGQRRESQQNDMYFHQEDQHNAVDTAKYGFFGDTYDPQEFFIPMNHLIFPLHLPRKTTFFHKNYENYDAFHAQESGHINLYAPDQNDQTTYDSYDTYNQY